MLALRRHEPTALFTSLIEHIHTRGCNILPQLDPTSVARYVVEGTEIGIVR